MHKSLHKCPAYWPRQHRRSTVDYYDKLEVAYCVWTQDKSSKAAPERPEDPSQNPALNFVFVHGSQCCKEIFEHHASLLFDHFGSRVGKCIGIDVVSHGDSALLNHDKLGAYAAWDDIARDVGLVVRDALDVRTCGPIFYIGHSMGATAGLLLGCLEPKLLSGIVALDPILLGPEFSTVGPVCEGNLALADRALKAGRDSFPSVQEFEKYYHTRFCRNWDPEVRRLFVPAAAVVSKSGQVRTKANMANQVSAYMSMTSSLNASRSFFCDLRVPTLVVYAVSPSGRRTTPSDAGFLETLLEDASVFSVVGGHNFPFEAPKDTMAHVYPFVEAHMDQDKWHNPPVQGDAATAFQFEQLKALMVERGEAMVAHYNDPKLPNSKL